MVERREHAPKIGALEAYRAGRLSGAGRARLERHLRTCAACREALEGAMRFARLARDVQGSELPAIEWSLFELPLQREALRLRRRLQWRRLGGALVLAAAAAVAVLVNRKQVTETSRPIASAPRQIAVAPASEPLRARVMAVAGSVDALDASGQRVHVGLDALPLEGWTLETGARSELHLALEGTAGLVVGESSKLVLRALRTHEVRLELLAGRVTNHVEKRAAEDHYEVTAEGRHVVVRGTRFAVELAPGLNVQVDEGIVVVLAEDSGLLAELRAPARWSTASGVGANRRPLCRPLEAGPAVDSWPVLELPTWPHVDVWELVGAELTARSELAMRAPAGDVDVVALLDDGRRLVARIHLDAMGARFDPRALHSLGGNNRARGGSAGGSAPSPAQLASVLREGQVALQRCYERTLRDQQSSLTGVVRGRLRLVLDARGRVDRSEWSELAGTAPVPALLSECVQRVAGTWQFPAPGGSGLTFDAPISFRAAR